MQKTIGFPMVLGHCVGWVMGFEPTHAWTTTMCLNHLTIPTICLSFLRPASLFLAALAYVLKVRALRAAPVRLASRKKFYALLN